MRNRICIAFATITIATTMISACSSSQEQPERQGLPSGASSVASSAEEADGDAPMRREADEMGEAGTAPEMLRAQLDATAGCAAGSVTVNGQPVNVGGIRYERWVKPAMDEATDHFHVFSEAINCDSSLDDSVEAYELMGHIAAEKFGPLRVLLSSGGVSDPSAPITISDNEGRLEICIEEPVTIDSATRGTQVWQGRFQATAYCGSMDVTGD